MKVGLFLPLVGPFANPDYLAAAARAADDSGFHSLWVGEHVVLFDAPESRYPYSVDGSFPVPADSGMLEPFVALSYVAGMTERVRLGTGVCLVPQRQPLYTARSVADLDVLSRGRVDFGVGIGWQREEFEALGVPFERRGRRCREYIEAMKSLWTHETSTYEGATLHIPAVRFYPKPVQRPHPPILFGGESDAALRRVAKIGDGWFGFNIAPTEAAAQVARLDAALAREGRGRAGVEVKISPYLKPGGDPEGLHRYAEAGVDEVILATIAGSPDEVDALIRGTADDLLPVAAKL